MISTENVGSRGNGVYCLCEILAGILKAVSVCSILVEIVLAGIEK